MILSHSHAFRQKEEKRPVVLKELTHYVKTSQYLVHSARLTGRMAANREALENCARMTSTSFNVGLNDNTRLSSRVLRPPGGGHTDIFGGEPEPQQITRRGPPASTIGSTIGQEEPRPANGTEAPSQNGQKSPSEATPAPAPAPVAAAAPAAAPEPKAAEPPKRVRVPPGGFSSGLW
ncbi:jupiter microtubule associated homolog 1-like isoform X1 [Helicoverpa zea]|uniref:jupiter microtubule associated homolog 1-like isoform X1 n=2 Tax=Helicoverpa zea TaxID=7113 RepID=UPI001F59E13B|nr:jupiter microtubule associated homolog 1-like isoform X1 [Helicoverpa zea]